MTPACVICLPNPILPSPAWVGTTGMNIVIVLMTIVLAIYLLIRWSSKRKANRFIDEDE